MLMHHERWYDEAGPWLIARDADLPAFFKILFQNYDRHPGLFYILLFPFAKLGFPYFTLSCLNWLICISAAAIFILKAPLPRIVKYLYVFSFYMLYEYAVISRPYGLAILLIFLIAAHYPRRFINPVLYAVWISLLFNTEYLCFGFAAGLTALFIYEIWESKNFSREVLWAIALMCLSGLLAFITGSRLQPDHAEYGVSLPFLHGNIFPAILKAFLPFDIIFGKIIVPKILLSALAWSTLTAALLSFIRQPRLFWIISIAFAEFFYIFTRMQTGDLRHYGFILIVLIFVIWVQKSYPEENRVRDHVGRKFNRIALALMSFCFLFGVRYAWFSYQLDYHLPFSGSKTMAAEIRKLWREQPILTQFVIVAKDTSTASILPYLPEVRFWNPCVESFPKVHYALKKITDCNSLSQAEMIKKAWVKFGNLDRVLFLAAKPLTLKEIPGYNFYLLANANQYVFGYNYETFYLYLAARK